MPPSITRFEPQIITSSEPTLVQFYGDNLAEAESIYFGSHSFSALHHGTGTIAARVTTETMPNNGIYQPVRVGFRSDVGTITVPGNLQIQRR